jgi:hypothetical protein
MDKSKCNFLSILSITVLGFITMFCQEPMPNVMPLLLIDDVNISESTDTLTFTVRLSEISGQAVSVDYTTTDGTAVSPTDYTSTSGTMSIPAGSPSGTISVSIADDVLDEEDETFLVDLSNPVNASITDNQGEGTITDDDTGLPSVNLIFEETFEGPEPFSTAHSWDIGDWDYALQFVSSPVFQGTHSARFEIREEQPLVKDGKRAEVVIVKGSEGDISKNTWYSFAVYFPSDGYEYDDKREAINQWYQDGSPATSLRTEEDRIILETGNEQDTRKEIDIGAITKDEWHTFVFHFIHSHGSDGLIEVWHNGNKTITRTGGNMYDDILPKWKIGLYKSSFKSGTSDVNKRIIFFDNIRVGNEKATFDEMKPYQ